MFNIEEMAARLVEIPGVVGVMLGGSRARGEHRPDSDWDLGVYYREPLSVERLRTLAAELTGEPVEVAAPGGWGPWVNGGAWLDLHGYRVDWILRGLDRVRSVWDDCRIGRYEVGMQPGHPLGFWSPCYPGEVALGRVLADPTGELAALRTETVHYPEPLRQALTGAVWEAEFLVANAAKTASRGDVLHVSLSLSRAVGVLVQALFAHHRRWCLNEKGALAAVAAMPGTPRAFAGTANPLLGSLGSGPAELSARVAQGKTTPSFPPQTGLDQARSAGGRDPGQYRPGTDQLPATAAESAGERAVARWRGRRRDRRAAAAAPGPAGHW